MSGGRRDGLLLLWTYIVCNIDMNGWCHSLLKNNFKAIFFAAYIKVQIFS